MVGSACVQVAGMREEDGNVRTSCKATAEGQRGSKSEKRKDPREVTRVTVRCGRDESRTVTVGGKASESMKSSSKGVQRVYMIESRGSSRSV